MISTTTIDRSNVSSEQLCVFLSSYATWLLGCGATCIRLEKNVGRIAAAFNKRADITIMPRHIHWTITDNCLDERFTSTATVMNSAIDFDMNARLSRLSWKIADSPISLTDACKLFSKIIVPSYQSAWAVLLLASSANASFCRLFGGDGCCLSCHICRVSVKTDSSCQKIRCKGGVCSVCVCIVGHRIYGYVVFVR